MFITGGTGYMGSRLVPALRARGHRVYTLVRPGSEAKAPSGAISLVGNVLSRDSIAGAMPHGAVVVHLVGTPHPSPVEGRAVRGTRLSPRLASASPPPKHGGARRFVYVSVAHPAPGDAGAYIDVRVRVEQLLREGPLPCTILRPWYVLGPGHRWPYFVDADLLAAPRAAFDPRRSTPTRLGHDSANDSRPRRRGRDAGRQERSPRCREMKGTLRKANGLKPKLQTVAY